MTLTFDASGSLAQGFNDTIVRYEWRFGDEMPPVIKTEPKVTKVFTQNVTYIVTLNVTDSEGLWNTTSKSVDVFIYIPPKADFTWSPNPPYAGQLVTFDAGITILGWNGTAAPPIVSYFWDFGDGYTINVSTPTVTHTYALGNNYTVTLTVKDKQGQQGYKSKVLTILSQPPQGNGDVDGDGRVTMTDIIIVVAAFGSTTGKPNWDPRADIDKNGKVDMTDIMIVVSNFGKKYS
jgi:PKD repeat protein